MLSRFLLPRSLRQTVIILLVFLSLIAFGVNHWRRRPSPRALRLAAFEGHLATAEDVTQMCAAHRFAPAPSHGRRKRRVYDLFLLSTELDWLEIRLNTLYHYVDYLVIVESNRTFTGLPKPLHLWEHWRQFDTFHPKIIYVKVKDEVNSTVTWGHEDAFRDALLYQSVAQLAGTEHEPQHGDALIVSDIDEIPRPETVTLLRYCDFPDRLTLRSHLYYYSFQWLHKGEQWPHPQATVFRGLNATISPTGLRNGEGGPQDGLFGFVQRRRQKADLFDAAWHCSSCFRTMEEMLTKVKSISHTRWNTEKNRDPKTVIDRVRNGKVLFDRKGEIYDKVEDNPDVPNFILDHQQDYRYLLDRDGKDAGFSDVKEDLIAR